MQKIFDLFEMFGAAPEVIAPSGAFVLALALAVIVWGIMQLFKSAIKAALGIGVVGNGLLLLGAIMVLKPGSRISTGTYATLPPAVWSMTVFLAVVALLIIGASFDTAGTESSGRSQKPAASGGPQAANPHPHVGYTAAAASRAAQYPTSPWLSKPGAGRLPINLQYLGAHATDATIEISGNWTTQSSESRLGRAAFAGVPA